VKVREILLELAEVLDRHSAGQYGAWIDSNTGKIYYVEEFGHANFMERNFPESKKTDAYTHAYQIGLVRVEFNRPQELNVEGKGKDIQKIARILIATITQPDMDECNIEKISGVGYAPHRKGSGYKGFGLPEDRRAAIQYINAG
jgi:hypothetical protein